VKSNTFKKLTLAVLMTTTLAGCMGQMGLAGLVTKVNLKVVDNRWLREGVFLLLAPVYGFASFADLFVFNSIEFWIGKNIITGKSPARVDVKIDAWIKANDSLSSELKTAPLANIQKTQTNQIDADTLETTITYTDGSTATILGEKDGDLLNVYLNGELISIVSVSALAEYHAQTEQSLQANNS
jgi:hypothetical protein